ncbi:MAG: GvpL/GvpF family gas vesicle protein, partial [Candidatus Tectomicrobia bacterium]|nr:GvpL/GvpF family gas vesicle protein [Candidatus Tectomicrobia bacterium]
MTIAEESPPRGKYFYAVILADGEQEFGNIGLEGARVYTISYSDIAAVVS